jgi:hypothetical protein
MDEGTGVGEVARRDGRTSIVQHDPELHQRRPFLRSQWTEKKCACFVHVTDPPLAKRPNESAQAFASPQRNPFDHPSPLYSETTSLFTESSS